MEKTSGVKIHIAVVVRGIPYALGATTADVTDRNGAILMFSQPDIHLPWLLEVEIAKRSELYKFAVIPKRWVVERTFGWLDKFRLLWKNCERLLENTLNMVKLDLLEIVLKNFKQDLRLFASIVTLFT